MLTLVTDMGLAGCRTVDPDEMFPDDPTDDRPARLYCTHCPVRASCLEKALRTGSREGIWGGLTEAQRAELHNRHSTGLDVPPMERRPERCMTDEERLELSDAMNYATLTERREFRLKIGELYHAGVTKRELMDVTGKYQEYIFRSVREYRLLYGIPVDQREHKPKTQMALGWRKSRMLGNYRHMAKHAPSPAAKAFWQQKVDEFVDAHRIELPLSA